MSIKFIPKFGTSLIAGGGLGVSGFVAYNNTVPKNIQEALEREGIPFIKSISDENARNRAYKAVYIDNEKTIKSDISNVTTSADEAYSKIEKWCNDKLSQKYSGSALNKDREKIINYCSDQVPRTVEGRLRRIEDQKWIKDETNGKDEAYKAIFAIYRYDQKFLDLINGDENTKHTQATEAETGYTRLQTWCEKNLKSEVALVADENLYSYVFWWCKKLDYETTVEEKIKHDYSGWKKASSEWTSIKGIWQHTSEVFSVVDTSKSSSPDGKDISDDKYKNWCDATLKKNIYDKDVYQKEYLIAKSVCADKEIQYKLGEKKSLKEAIEAVKAK
ncbi:hypothetical protein MHSWG343_04010 [Candidatus Mycoplasma haematohominis]|uniref:Uncharacterized protein n=1 Tax=Candidatus Mycoplasma haematohominis TaxID=1494318 RepID=A0A478FTI5_9MOLU|nr:hypothetical protein MHSWG343_04010 [Candidatus Mycoplasma haemohominis]